MTHLTARDWPSLNDVFFRDFFHDTFYQAFPSVKKVSYPVDVYQTEDGDLAIDIAAIGLEKSDIQIDIKDDVISVAHEKNEPKDDKRGYRGITQKSFNLAWRVNEKFDLNKAQAELDKGLLMIRVPLAPEKKPRTLEVKIK